MTCPSGRRALGEDCGVVAVVSPGRKAAELVHRALHALQHRGQEAAGIVAWSGGTSHHHLRARGLVSEALPTYRVRDLPGEVAIGHVRYSTVPADQAENIQPFLATLPFGKFAIAHNGNMKNADEIRENLEAQGSLLSTTMDTELVAHLIARSGAKDFPNALGRALEPVQGAYSLTMLCDDKAYGLRDPFGVRPLVLGKFDQGWILASETCALDLVQAEFVRALEPGELVELSPSGPRFTQLLPKAKPGSCVFELVYFARPDSVVFGQSVYAARTQMGEALAEQDDERAIGKPDIVVPVPDSGFPAAIGYARRSGVPLEKAIIRSHYVGRTFILPDQDARSHSVQMKLSVIREAVDGKKVLLVDDSIVRGNTSRKIVQMVRDAGAKEVWMRIASPPLSWPCYLGIDTPSREELVINRVADVEGVAKHIGADDLRYLSLDNLKRAAGGDAYCFGCMTGDYPI